MDFVNKLTGKEGEQAQHSGSASGQSNEGGGLMGKLNSAMGGGQAGENKEDPLDKAVDFVQEHIFHQGQQTNESAIEQAKDETISDTIRSQYKNMTGKEFPIKDKS